MITVIKRHTRYVWWMHDSVNQASFPCDGTTVLISTYNYILIDCYQNSWFVFRLLPLIQSSLNSTMFSKACVYHLVLSLGFS